MDLPLIYQTFKDQASQNLNTDSQGRVRLRVRWAPKKGKIVGKEKENREREKRRKEKE